MRNRTSLIFNARAGSAARFTEKLQRFLKQTGCEFHATTGPGDSRQYARAAVEAGVQRIIVAGGDGTINQVINGLAPDFAQVELGIVPLGTGNDLARSLGLPADSPQSALSLAVNSGTQPIDLVRLTDGSTSYLINVATGGFGGKVAADLNDSDKCRWGALAYWITAVRELADIHELQIEVALDGQSRRWRVYGVAVANGRYVGGGFPIAPRALLNDGLLDVTVMPVLPAMELLAAGLDYMLGVAGETNRVPTFRARRVSITATPAIPFSIDGEPVQELTATFEVLPGVLRVVTGEIPRGLAQVGLTRLSDEFTVQPALTPASGSPLTALNHE